MLLDCQSTWFEVRAARPDIALLPIGATEQNGDHLPVGSVNIILDALCRRVGQRLQGAVYLLPTMPLGTSGLHLGQPGTVALEWRTLMKVVYDLVESLMVQGIHKVMLINGLGGAAESTVMPRENYIVKTAVRQLNYDFPELDAVWVQPFTVAGKELEGILESATQDLHAGELVTSLMLYLGPEAVKGQGTDFAPDVGREYLDYVPFASLCPGGVWGRPSLASAEKGKRAMDVAVERTVAYIKDCLSRLATMKGRV